MTTLQQQVQQAELVHKADLVEILLNLVSDTQQGIISYEDIAAVEEGIKETGLTRNDVAKVWDNEPHPVEAGLTPQQFRLRENRFSAVTAVYDLATFNKGELI